MEKGRVKKALWYTPSNRRGGGNRRIFLPLIPNDELSEFKPGNTYDVPLSHGRTATARISEGTFPGQIGYVLYIDGRKQEGVRSIPEGSDLEELFHFVRMASDPDYWAQHIQGEESISPSDEGSLPREL